MAKEFTPLTRAQFDEYLSKFRWTRQITNVHMHHTWQPNHAQWKGLKSVRGMYDFHTKTNGWSDIAQHVTIAPDGIIWLGRNWNKSPASSNGFNGNNLKGPFMFETVGNFDVGRDKLEGEQLKSVLHVIAAIQENRRLQTENLKFHRHLNSPKTCPGSGVSYDDILDQVNAYKKQMKAPPQPPVLVSLGPANPQRKPWWKWKGWWNA